MNLFSNLQQQYDQLWKYIIRPKRNTYPQKNLGPQTFQLQGKKIKRIDFQVVNSRGHVLFASHFVPLEQQSYPCLIYMHGNSSNRTQGMQYLGHLMRQNISLCTFDFSGCGNSEGEYVSLGYYQQNDLDQIVKYIKSRLQITSIAIWGRSMGAVTGLLYLRKSQHICAAVFDSPFKSLKSLIEDLCKKNSKIPTLIIQGALKIIAGTIAEKAKFDIYKLNPLKYDVPYLKYPAFFIVGLQDDLIPPQHTLDLFEYYKGPKKYLQTVKGNHNDSRPQECVEKVIDFLIQNLTSQIVDTDRNISSKQKDLSPKKRFIHNIDHKQKQFDFFNDEYEDTIENSSKQTENIDFFSEQFQKQLGQISFNLQSKKIELTNNTNNFSFTNMFSNIFSTNIKQSKPRQIDGYEKVIERVSKQLIIEDTLQVKKHKKRAKEFQEKQLAQIRQFKNNNFEKEILMNLEFWAF